MPNATDIYPQAGPQMAFMSSPADVVVYGGAAGAGKSFAILMEALRYIKTVNGFGVVIFRRTFPQITNEGGLWDSAYQLYIGVGGRPKESTLEWEFPPYDNRIKFAHMQHEKDRTEWDGAQIPLIMFDQLEHFTKKQFFYMLSRSRSTCGIKPYIRATCNPDPDHWLRSFMDWWIDEDGYPIPERSGVVRWFIVINDEVHWADDAEALTNKFGDEVKPKSFTFISGKIEDNKILLRADPGYLANLEAMPLVDRLKLRHGNWNARECAGMIFRRDWFEIMDAVPAPTETIRYWDRAATKAPEGEKEAKASWTVGLKMGRCKNGLFVITDVIRFQGTPLEVETAIQNTASQDTKAVEVWLEQDPAQAGKAEVQALIRMLAGYTAKANAVRESKGLRAKPLSAQVQAGNVKLLRAKWNESYINEMQNFDGTDSCVADQVDASSGAFMVLTRRKKAGVWGRG